MSKSHSTEATEEWRDVFGFEGYYQVSSLGNVQSLPRVVRGWNGFQVCHHRRKGVAIKPGPIGKCGHLAVYLTKEGVRATKYVHRLVLEAFVGPCPDGKEACHFPNRDVTDNRVINLRWGTHQDNMGDKVAHGTSSGWKLSESFCIKQRNRKLSDETRAKISAAVTLRWAKAREG